MTADVLSLTDRLQDTDLLRTAAFVDGEWVGAEEHFDVRNPATGEVIAVLPSMDASAARSAIERAEAALPAWRARPAIERSRILRRWADLIRDHADDIASILTAEQGKPWAEARGEVLYSSQFLDWFAEEGRRVYGDVVPSHTADARIIVLKQAIGVTAGITPWNLPAAMITRKAAPALAAGCTIVMKPAEQTPLTALALARLAERAGVPSGVLNMLPSDDAPPIGTEFTTNATVRKLSFTGSTEVGKLLMAQASRNVQKLSLELGGNSPFIVFDDAGIDEAVEGIVSTKYRNAGQICTGANRVLVQRGILDDFVEALRQRTQRVTLGNGFDHGVEMGPLIDAGGLEKVERHVADLIDRGGTVVTGGRRSDLGRTFFEPTVITNVGTDTLPWQDEETFGPVAAVTAFDDEDEAIALANSTEYGLVAYVYTHDVGRIFRVSEALETGMVAVNSGRVSNEQAPFGGVKQSGLGREGSRYGIDDWLELKYINLAGLSRR
ncbi:MAG: NAD-dependent succinate-semialdehyde dehydrogenase [Microbacterium sp.]|uniref:NAD-dependent succinate-semialdehyde dehydrogenase n=1 Tax=Microbacterium sp. TaxID=51671 RepID=UPI00261681E9|nr:NAD-dependent succinate-semialdehyde dehydrogenase [Microbacterium sp.]MCX6502940.1 NAD-dependent succinate-semialdehyde dehydrogenase [Microbacterium sp.]